MGLGRRGLCWCSASQEESAIKRDAAKGVVGQHSRFRSERGIAEGAHLPHLNNPTVVRQKEPHGARRRRCRLEWYYDAAGQSIHILWSCHRSQLRRFMQVEQDFVSTSSSQHVVNIGKMIEDMECVFSLPL